MQGNIKMSEIARQLGVSVVTVSKALNGKEGVSKELREKIIQKTRELDYKLSAAARAIRSRLIDYYRKEKRHEHVGSLHAPADEEEKTELLDMLPDQKNEVEAYEMREASRKEIQEFEKQLAALGITFSDVADNCPKQERTLAACRGVLDYARKNPELLDRFVKTGRLPVNELSQGSGTDKKTMERHRKYLAAILLAFTNGYEIIRGHLCQIGPGKGGSGR